MRNLKAFGLALVAAFALSAVVASAASAEFTSSSDSTTLFASALSTQTFTAGGAGEEASVNCTGISVDGASLGTSSSEITAEPTYSGCSVSQGGSTFEGKVDPNGCHYVFTTSETNNVHIVCPEGQVIKVTAKILGAFRECLDIHAQTPTNAVVDYSNNAGSPMDVKITSTVTGITYEKTGLCKGSVNEANNASYTGEVTVTGKDAEGNTVDVTVSH